MLRGHGLRGHVAHYHILVATPRVAQGFATWYIFYAAVLVAYLNLICPEPRGPVSFDRCSHRQRLRRAVDAREPLTTQRHGVESGLSVPRGAGPKGITAATPHLFTQITVQGGISSDHFVEVCVLLGEDVCVALVVGFCVAVRDAEPVALSAHGGRLRGAARCGARDCGRLPRGLRAASWPVRHRNAQRIRCGSSTHENIWGYSCVFCIL